MSQEIAKFKEFSKTPISERLVYIDPLLSSNHFPSINPFYFVENDERSNHLMAQEIIKILNILLKDATTTSHMNAILYPCINVLLRRNNSSLADLKRFMNDEQNQDLIKEGLKLDNHILRDFFSNKFQNKTLNVSKHAIEMRLQTLLNDPLFQRLLL